MNRNAPDKKSLSFGKSLRLPRALRGYRREVKYFLRSPILLVVLLFCFAPSAHAEKFWFSITRYNDLQLDSTPGKENVTVEVMEGSSKGDMREKTVLNSKLKAAGNGTYITPGGTTFKLEKLSKKVLNDANRKINSGTWKVTVSGTGPEYTHLKQYLSPTFGDTGRTELYGDINPVTQ